MDVLTRAVRVRPWLAAMALGTGVFVVYALTRRADNPYNQYVLLADAFLSGRLHLVDPPAFLEIASFGSRAYVIDPPAPTLFLLPFVAVFGPGTDHVLISCAVGAGAIVLLWTAAKRLWTDNRFAVAMTLLVAFGTNFWWIASDGGFWSFAHTSAVFFLAAALVVATQPTAPWLAGLFVGLAGLSRLPVFLIAPLYLFLVLNGELRLTRDSIRKTAWFSGLVGVCAIGYLAYNQARYGTFTDAGYYHPQYIDEPWFAHGRFDVRYIPRHLRAIFYEIPVFGGFPFVRPRSVGVALVLTTPALLYTLRARLDRQTIAALVALGLVAIPLLTHGTTGWSQFGYRFALDTIPALLILTASGMRERLSPFKAGVIGFGVLVNLWGVLAFNRYDWIS